jgi:hypothetical protein
MVWFVVVRKARVNFGESQGEGDRLNVDREKL